MEETKGEVLFPNVRRQRAKRTILGLRKEEGLFQKLIADIHLPQGFHPVHRKTWAMMAQTLLSNQIIIFTTRSQR